VTRYADLHIHTFYSDGTDSPEEVVRQAKAKRLSCIAISDHDTLDAIEPILPVAADAGIEVLTGIELSTEHEGKDVHILGYCFDHHNEGFIARIREFQQARLERIKDILDKLKGHGIDNITLEEIQAMTKSDSLGRPHVAKKLIEKGWVRDNREAFERYLAEDGLAYVAKFRQTPREAIELLHAAGGVAVMAHPMVTKKDQIIPELVEAGLDGLEVFYPNFSQSVIMYYKTIAEKYQLLMTGGSDAHGKAKTNTSIGKKKIPYELVEKIKQAAQKRQGPQAGV